MAPFLGSEGSAVKDAKEYDPLSGEPRMRFPQRFSAGFQLGRRRRPHTGKPSGKPSTRRELVGCVPKPDTYQGTKVITMTGGPARSRHIASRYFHMWNTGDTSIAPEVLGADWADHAHPEISGPADVQRAVEQTRAARPGLRFEIETILGDGDLISVVGGVGHESRPGEMDSRLIWLIRLVDGRMTEMWTYRLSTPAGR